MKQTFAVLHLFGKKREEGATEYLRVTGNVTLPDVQYYLRGREMHTSDIPDIVNDVENTYGVFNKQGTKVGVVHLLKKQMTTLTPLSMTWTGVAVRHGIAPSAADKLLTDRLNTRMLDDPTLDVEEVYREECIRLIDEHQSKEKQQ